MAHLPQHMLTGYWHNFYNGAKCLRIRDIPLDYDMIVVSFADSTPVPGAVTFALNSEVSEKLNGYSRQEFIEDIQWVKARGQKVILSVGGELGNIEMTQESHAVRFAESFYDLMNEYGFEGVDIDLEHGIPEKLLELALRRLHALAGPELIIAMAPQTLDMQDANQSYFKLALNIKDILTVVNTQFYNSGAMLGLDGKSYKQGSVDFITAQAALQLESGLRPDQVGLGFPSCIKAAGSGYVDPSVVLDAYTCLTQGVVKGTYLPPRTYPTLRGLMTWSINWDATFDYQFSRTVAPVLKASRQK